MKRCTDVHYPQRISSNELTGPSAFSSSAVVMVPFLVISFLSKCLDKLLDGFL